MKVNEKALAVAAFVASLAILVGCSPLQDTDTSGRSNDVPDLQVLDTSITPTEFGNRNITGTVANHSTKTYGYVAVEFNLYDAAGNQVGDTIDSVHNLEPGRRWKFKAFVVAENTTRYKLKRLVARE